jgi:hypothetical protein
MYFWRNHPFFEEDAVEIDDFEEGSTLDDTDTSILDAFVSDGG